MKRKVYEAKSRVDESMKEQNVKFWGTCEVLLEIREYVWRIKEEMSEIV